MLFSLTEKPIRPDLLRSPMLNQEAGGFCVFEGWVRNHHLGRGVTRLDYEAYQALALKVGEKILHEILDQHSLTGIRAEHRIGSLVPGDLAIWVGACAPHRDKAFEACRHAVDEIKAHVPIWKHEFYTDGSDEWVDPTACHCAHSHSSKTAKGA